MKSAEKSKQWYLNKTWDIIYNFEKYKFEKFFPSTILHFIDSSKELYQ